MSLFYVKARKFVDENALKRAAVGYNAGCNLIFL